MDGVAPVCADAMPGVRHSSAAKAVPETKADLYDIELRISKIPLSHPAATPQH